MKKIILWALAIALAVVLLFLYQGCSVQSSELKTNWQDGEYIVDEQSDDSIRQLYRDAGFKVYPPRGFTKKETAQVNTKCISVTGYPSRYIGIVLDMNNLNMQGKCTFLHPFPDEVVYYLCMLLKMEIKWRNPETRKFACSKPSRGKALE